jgi:hypothetical protein
VISRHQVATMLLLLCVGGSVRLVDTARAQKTDGKRQLSEQDVQYPPVLPGGESVVTDTSVEFLRPTAPLKDGVAIAKTAPTVDFMFYPGQDYAGRPWSNWGQSLAVSGKYYSAIGDHLSIRGENDASNASRESAHTGNAFVYGYDPATKVLRRLTDVASVLGLPPGHYTPGKIHGRLDMGTDGHLYFATHRGSEKGASDKNQYRGDWILRCDPRTGQSEVVAAAPVAKHSIPNSALDPERMIFYGGTAAGPDAKEQGIRFFAYDVKRGKLLYAGPDGPARSMMMAHSTGRVYYVAGADEGQLMRFDPTVGVPEPVEGITMGIRAATRETPQGYVYAVSSGQGKSDANLWAFNTRTEKVERLGSAAVGTEAYVASLDADSTGRFVYYVPGAHGSSPRDGSPLVQFDVHTGKKKVIALLHPFYERKYGCALKGTYAVAVDQAGDKVYVTWNVSRGTRAWDCCGLTVIHVPASER